MSKLSDEADAQFRRRERIEAKAHRDMVRTYRTVLARVRAHVAHLVALIEDAERRGVEVRPGWLFEQERYIALVRDLEEDATAFAHRAHQLIVGAQLTLVQQAVLDGYALTKTALGPAPRRAVTEVERTFNRVPQGALDQLIGISQAGRPLGVLLSQIAPDGAHRVRDALAFGVAAGRSPRAIAREVMAEAGVPLTRALAISREETLRAYRSATTLTHQSTGIVRQWRWYAHIVERTCAVCLAMHGTVHPASDELESHICCRCAKLPITPSWEELGFPGIADRRPNVTPGIELFDRLSRSQKLEVLGPGKLAAYDAGKFTLADLVRPTQSAMWGPGLREATLAEVAR